MTLLQKFTFGLTYLRFLIVFVSGFVGFYMVACFLQEALSNEMIGLYVVLELMLVMVVVVFLIVEWLRLQRRSYLGSDHHYSNKEILHLYIKTLSVVSYGYVLGLLFLLYSEANILVKALFLSIDVFLTLYATSSIFKSERMRELNMRNIQSENQLLKSQLNPHFLYNTLNNIDALIYYDADKASQAVITLSSLMRYMTYQANRTKIALSEEVLHLDEYISLQKLRFENPRAIVWEHKLEQDPLISPMLLMPIVENCFKHSAGDESDENVAITLVVSDNKLQLITKNKIKVNTESLDKSRSGVGLSTLRSRLKLLYPKSHSLTIDQEDGLFVLNLTINFSI